MEGERSSVDNPDGITDGTRPASQNAPTESELLALAADDDGTVTGEEAAEKKRIKEEDWATYTDSHAKGAGNRMNKG